MTPTKRHHLFEKYRQYLVNRQLQGTSPDEVARHKKRHKRRVRRFAKLCLPIVIAIRLLRPIVLIRFGYILRHKIGHCPLELEFYLLERAAGIQPMNAIDLFYFDFGTDGQSANLFAEALARRNARLYSWVEYLAAANDMLPGGDAHRLIIQFRDTQEFADSRALLANYPQQINLSAEEEDLGRELLNEMGVPDGAKFICFHIREAAYWKARKANINNDSDFRNSDLRNCFEAMRVAAERGYYVLRIGASVPHALPDLHPRVIDYASTARTEFMDVFLAMRCDLMVSTGSGIDAMSYFCRRPLLLLNLVAWAWVFVRAPQPFACIFKQFWRMGRPMTFVEVTEMRANEFIVTNEYERAGITLEENSSNEISDAVTEMLDRIEGRATLDPGDEERREKMRSYIRRAARYTDWQFDVSPSYLRKHEGLL